MKNIVEQLSRQDKLKLIQDIKDGKIQVDELRANLGMDNLFFFHPDKPNIFYADTNLKIRAYPSKSKAKTIVFLPTNFR